MCHYGSPLRMKCDGRKAEYRDKQLYHSGNKGILGPGRDRTREILLMKPLKSPLSRMQEIEAMPLSFF